MAQRGWSLPIAVGFLVCGCRTGSTAELPGNVTYAAAATAGARFRADAGCYALCTAGSICNHATGYCCEPGSLGCQDADPCGGKCSAGQSCESAGLVPHCVSLAPSGNAGTAFVGNPNAAVP